MKRILAPHKEQDGWVYVRVGTPLGRKPLSGMFAGLLAYFVPGGFPCDRCGSPSHRHNLGSFVYDDSLPNSRTISSRRVEEAVETADYLKRCADEDLDVRCWSAVFENGEWANATGQWWIVWKPEHKKAMPGGSPTLREAYYRYHARADR